MTKKGKACENEPEFLIKGNNEEKEDKIKENKGEYHLAYANTKPNAKECL